MKFIKLIFVSLFFILFVATCTAKKDKNSSNQKVLKSSTTDSLKSSGKYTVEEIYKNIEKLNGKNVTLNGKVAKVNENILGKNWIHIQDGTGNNKTSDLTVTTNDKVKKGTNVLITGIVTKDKDFGSGYKYAVIVENAKVTVK